MKDRSSEKPNASGALDRLVEQYRSGQIGRRLFLRQAVAAGLSSAAAYAALGQTQVAAQRPSTMAIGEEGIAKPPPATTFAVGEEGPVQRPSPNPPVVEPVPNTTGAYGEEQPPCNRPPTTTSLGEESQPSPTTQAIGEESQPPATTYAVGEESAVPPPATTRTLGEENFVPPPTTQAFGEEGQSVTTRAVGEETTAPPATTRALGEEGSPPPASTQAIGEEGGPPATTTQVGEEGQLVPQPPVTPSPPTFQTNPSSGGGANRPRRLPNLTLPNVWKSFRRW